MSNSTILIAGAGKSSSVLIQYLADIARRSGWRLIVADENEEAISEKLYELQLNSKSDSFEQKVLNFTNEKERKALVKEADLVISLLPSAMHILLAKDCLQFKKHFIMSSYITPEIQAMDEDVRKAGLMFMCEMGLDPGLDHMSAHHIIHSTQKVAAVITSFKSYCGALIAPESDNNSWHYKFTWNPQNVVKSGYGGAQYLENGKQKNIGYKDVFGDTRKVTINGIGNFLAYPNKNSLPYISMYDIPEATTFIRSTLRHPDYIKGWQAVVALGLTDDSDKVKPEKTSYLYWVREKIGASANDVSGVKEHIAGLLKISKEGKVIKMMEDAGFFEEASYPSDLKCSADILLHLLQGSWATKPLDKDLVLMQHEVEYIHRGRNIKLKSTLAVKGESMQQSAIAKTVGLPIGMLAKQILTGKIAAPVGVRIPNMPSVYRSILKELNHYGISFTEEVE